MKPVYGERALLLKDTLVIADLHIGVEREFRDSGIRVPKQTHKMEDRIKDLLDMTGAKDLVILGDLKHNIPNISWEEYQDIPGFIDRLARRVCITLVKGNHDGDIERIVPDLEVVTEFKVNGYFLTHGHRRIDSLDHKVIIMAHNHPCVSFHHGLGGVSKESAWIRARLKQSALPELGLKKSPEIIIMPVFNEVLLETPVNKADSLLGPLFKRDQVDIDNAEAVLLDGTHLGRIKDLR